MKRKIIALITIVAMIMSLVPAMAIAEGTITLSLVGEYPYDTVMGAKIKVESEASLSSDETIEYYLNGTKVGECDTPGEFEFESVAGTNKVVAAVVDADGEIVGISEPLVLDFMRYTPIPGRQSFSNDFDDGVFSKSYFLSYDSTTKGAPDPQIVVDDETGSNCMKVSISGSSHNGWEVRYPGKEAHNIFKSGRLVYEYDVKFENFNGSEARLFFIKSSTGGEWVGGGPAEGTGNSVWAPEGKFEKNRWYNVKVVVDIDNRTGDCYVDGILVKSATFGTNFTNVYFVHLPRFMRYGNNASTFYVDNITLTNYSEGYGVTGYTDYRGERYEGLDTFPHKGAGAVLKFEGEMSDISEDDFTFTADGENVDFDFIFDSDNNEAILAPTERFLGGEECKIEYSSLKTVDGMGAFGNSYVEFDVAPPREGPSMTVVGEYDFDNFLGTKINVSTTAELLEGEKIIYYLNDEKVGESDTDGDFSFYSVAGENVLSAKVIDEYNDVVAVSNSIVLEFTKFAPMSGESYSLGFDSDVFDENDFYEFEACNKGYIPEIVTDAEADGNCMKVSIAGDDYNGWEMRFPGNSLSNTFSTGWVVYEYDVKFENFNSGSVNLFSIKTDSDEFICDGPAKDTGAWSKAPDGAFETNKWYNIKAVVNLDDKDMDMYIDGNLVWSDNDLGEDFSNINYFTLPRFVNFEDDAHSTYLIDNISVANYGRAYEVSKYTEIDGERTEGLDSFPRKGGSVVLSFSELLTSMAKDDFEFKVGGKNIDFEFSYDSADNEVTLTPLVTFSGDENCVIEYTYRGDGASGETMWRFFVEPPRDDISISLVGEYDSDCFVGTKITTSTTANLLSGEKIEYYQNDIKVGESDSEGEFTFVSVSGNNTLTAKIIDEDGFVADEAEPIVLDSVRYNPVSGKSYFLGFDDGIFHESDFFEYSYWNKGYDPEIVVDSETNDNCMKVSMSGTDKLGWEMRFPGSGTSNVFSGGWVVFEYDVKFENFNGGSTRLFFIKTGGGGEWYVAGPAQNSGASNLAPDGKFEKDRWYNVKAVMNLETKTGDLYVDGVLTLGNQNLGDKFSNILYANIPRFMNYSNTLESTFYIDNISITNYGQTFDVKGYTEVAGERSESLDSFPLSGASAVLKFSDKMSTVKKDSFVFKVDGKDVDFDFGYNAETLEATLTPRVTFAGREKCTIEFPDLKTVLGHGHCSDNKVEFSVCPPEYGITSVDFADFVPGETGEVDIGVTNLTNLSESGIILVGIYENNKLLSVKTSALDTDAQSESSTRINLKIPESYDSEIHALRVYLMNKNTYLKLDSVIK
ncbi:MAG: hypothetical protein IKV88_09450 [Clostridia bacterium]|nr:hypothetical protein [Clostridia bacterium]